MSPQFNVFSLKRAQKCSTPAQMHQQEFVRRGLLALYVTADCQLLNEWALAQDEGRIEITKLEVAK